MQVSDGSKPLTALKVFDIMTKRQAKKIKRLMYEFYEDVNHVPWKHTTHTKVVKIVSKEQRLRSAFPWPRRWGKWDPWPKY